MAKVWSFQKKLTVSASTVVALGVLLAAIPKASYYVELPETTEAIAGQVTENTTHISDVERWIQVQQEANELQRKWLEQQQVYQRPYPPQQIYRQDPYYDPYYRQERPRYPQPKDRYDDYYYEDWYYDQGGEM